MRKGNEVEEVEWKEWQISKPCLRPASPPCAFACAWLKFACPGRPRAQWPGWLGLRLRCATRPRFPSDPADGKRRCLAERARLG